MAGEEGKGATLTVHPAAINPASKFLMANKLLMVNRLRMASKLRMASREATPTINVLNVLKAVGRPIPTHRQVRLVDRIPADTTNALISPTHTPSRMTMDHKVPLVAGMVSTLCIRSMSTNLR